MMAQLLSQVHLALLAFLALLFCQAALHKAGDLRRFSGYLAHYHSRLAPLSFPLAGALLMAEGVAVALCVIPATSFCGQSLIAALLTLYTLALVIAKTRGKTEIVCGCGETPVRVSTKTLLRNLCLLAVAALMLASPSQPLSYAACASAAAAGLLLWIVWLLSEQLLRNSDLKQYLTPPSPDQELL
jgi:hypothetical protein